MNSAQMFDSGYVATERGCRKKIENKKGVKFYLNYWENEDMFGAVLISKNGTHFTVDVLPSCFGYNTFKVENFINDIWQNMKCQYVEKYNTKTPKWRQKTLLEQIAEENNAQK